MDHPVATGIVAAAGLYALVGVVFAPWFSWRGADRIDASASGSTLGFRLIILPGAVLLWPVLMFRLRRDPVVIRDPHRDASAS